MSRQRKHEAPEMGAMIDRVLRALVRRAGDGDTEAIEQLARLAGEIDGHVTASLVAGREFGYSLADLANVTGTTRQAVSQRTKAAKVHNCDVPSDTAWAVAKAKRDACPACQAAA